MKLSVGIKSLVIQIIAFCFCFLCLVLLNRLLAFTAPPIPFLLCCGVLAATLSFLMKFDWWWSAIHLAFPLIVYFAYQQDISPLVYLVALLACALVFWSTYRTQVPYYPSRASLAEPVSTLLAQYENPRFIDLGSGLGGLLFRLEGLGGTGSFFGIEIAPLPYWYSQWRRFYRRSNVKFLFGSYFDLDLSDFDVVFCYLSPAAMPDLWKKASAEMRKGTLLLSYEFIIPNEHPSFVLEIDGSGPPLYGWRI